MFTASGVTSSGVVGIASVKDDSKDTEQKDSGDSFVESNIKQRERSAGDTMISEYECEKGICLLLQGEPDIRAFIRNAYLQVYRLSSISRTRPLGRRQEGLCVAAQVGLSSCDLRIQAGIGALSVRIPWRFNVPSCYPALERQYSLKRLRKCEV